MKMLTILCFNGQLCLDKLKKIWEAIIICIIQDLEAEFLWTETWSLCVCRCIPTMESQSQTPDLRNSTWTSPFCKLWMKWMHSFKNYWSETKSVILPPSSLRTTWTKTWSLCVCRRHKKYSSRSAGNTKNLLIWFYKLLYNLASFHMFPKM